MTEAPTPPAIECCGDIADLLRSPGASQPVRLVGGAYVSGSEGGPIFPFKEGILCALPAVLEDRQQEIQSYYDRFPLPGYDASLSLGLLIEECLSDGLAEKLNRSLDPNSTILDAGCGTGHLSNFLGIVGRRVLGIDLSWKSLALAQSFNRANCRGSNVVFAQMDLTDPPLCHDSFDAAICDCVLQGIEDPEQALQKVVNLVKPGGYIVIRFHNRLGRLALRLVRSARAVRLSPYDSPHSMEDVLGWFERSEVDFIRSIPAAQTGEPDTLDYRRSLFEPALIGSRLDRLAVQVKEIAMDHNDGRFVMVGRKR